MQDKYKSLDPEIANAEHNVIHFRRHLYEQRFQECLGGSVSRVVGLQTGLTSFFVSWAFLRARGFTFSPMQVKKLPYVAALVVPTLLGT